MGGMNWKSIRLELARTRDFPNGSASRAYLLRLPLDRRGLVDRSALTNEPAQATVRRFFPSEPDLIGYVVGTREGWAFSYGAGEAQAHALCPVDPRPLRIGEHVLVTEPDGARLPFRVASLRALA